MADDIKISDLKIMLQARIHDLVKELLPTARIHGGYASVSSRGKKQGGSFVVWMKGVSPGAWKDFASDDKGDVIDLICYAGFGKSPPYGKEIRREAIGWAKSWLGVGETYKPLDLARAQAQARARAKEREEQEAKKAQNNQASAFQMYLNADATITGTVAETYFRSRGIDWGALIRLQAEKRFLERDIRFKSQHEYWLGAVHDEVTGRRIRRGPSFPALIAAMRDPLGCVRAVHCTYLKHDGSGKADVDKPKLMWPSTRGLIIRIGKGESGLTPEEAAAAGHKGVVVLTEGIEDAFSIVQARPDLRVWACGSLAGVGAAPFLPCVSAFIVAADNDWDSPEAQRGLEKALQALRAHGVPVTIARSFVGKDFNDALRENGDASQSDSAIVA